MGNTINCSLGGNERLSVHFGGGNFFSHTVPPMQRVDGGASGPTTRPAQEGSWLRRVLVVEDEPLVSALLCRVLEQSGFNTRPCSTALEAKSVIRDFDPDAALIDIHLGEGPSGLHLGHLFKRTHPHLGLVFLTKFHDPRVTGRHGTAVPKGSALLSKELVTDTAMLLEALESVLREGGSPPRHALAQPSGVAALTRTQLEILRLAASGLTNAGIARQRHTNERTVEQRLQSVYRTLDIPDHPDVNRRVEAVRQYIAVAGMPGSTDSPRANHD
jgi:DNA-binding NarL/FixJ family response regulator